MIQRRNNLFRRCILYQGKRMMIVTHQILTSRLGIHPMHPEEWPDVREMFLDFETSPEAIYDYPLPTTEEKAKEQVKVWSDSGYFYSVCLKGSSEVIGYLCFCGEQLREMGYSFKKKYQGQGYAQEAAQEMIAQMKQMGVNRIIAELALENLPSRKLIERLGFTQIGTKKHLFRKETGVEQVCGIFEKKL